MKTFSRRFAILGIALGLLGVSQSARADLTLSFSDGTNTVTYSDQAGTSTATMIYENTPGHIAVASGSSLGSFMIEGSATAPPALGTSSPTTLGVFQSSFDVTSTATGTTLTITETSTGGNFSPPSSAVTLMSSYNPTSLDGTSTYSATASGTGGSAGVSGSVTGTGIIGSALPLVSAPFSGNATGPFTVTNVITFTPNNSGSALNESLTTNLVAAPEPATLAMVFSALPLLGIAAWRRRRNPA